METVLLGSLYMSGNPVKFTGNTRTSYILNAPLELRTQDINVENKIQWVKFQNGVKKYLLSTNVLLTNISYDDLSKQAFINNQVIELEGVKYRVRIPSGGLSSRIENDKYSKANPSNEYDNFICNDINLSNLISPSGQDLSGSYTDENIITSASNNVWNWYKMATLSSSKTGYDVTIRGGLSVGYINTINQFARSSNVGWRILLEVYNQSPTISDSDKYLNSYTTSFKRPYVIYDGDADTMKITELIDDVSYRVLENQTTGFSTNFDLSTIWDSLSYGTHTMKIKVEDSFGNIVFRNWSFNKIQILSGESITLTKPLITTTNNSGILNPVNALENNTIYWNSVGGDLIYYNEINIVDNSDGTVVYNRKVESFDFNSQILKSSLINGKSYQIKVRTYNDSNQYSSWSDVVILKTFSDPIVYINGIINGQITVQNPLFTASFSQSDTYLKDDTLITVSDTLYSYQFILLKDNQTIAQSDILTDGLLQWQCSVGLDNKTNYNIKLLILTNGGVEKTYTEDFYAIYKQVRMNALLKVENNKQEGSCKLSIFAKQIVGRLESGDAVSFIDGESVSLHNSTIIFDDQSPFKVEGDFTMKLWARDLEDNNAMLIKLSNDICDIILTRYGNEFWIKKYVNNVLLYEKYDSVSGDINSQDELFFFIQHEASTGLMNFHVTRITDGTTTWYKPQSVNDLSPSISHTTYNAYDKEDGFLTNLSDGLKSLIIPVSIDGVNTKVYLPSKDNLIGENAYPLFKNISPIEDSNYMEERNILGEYVIGDSLLGSDSTTNSNINIRIKNNYSGSNPLIIKYKVFNYANLNVNIYEKIDNIIFNTRKNIKYPEDLDNEFILDLTSIWNDISYGMHTIKINLIDSTGYSYNKEFTFGKASSRTGTLSQSAIDLNTNTTLTLTKGQSYKYYTRTIDITNNEKIVTIDSLGDVSSEYPNNMATGERIVLNLPVGARCTTYKDSKDDCYIVTTKLNNIFTTQTLGDLKVGDKIKECFTIYSDENIEFTIVDKNETMVTVMTDIISIKPFDVAESVLIHGDIIWNQSNIKQWLNSNNKLVRRK